MILDFIHDAVKKLHEFNTTQIPGMYFGQLYEFSKA